MTISAPARDAARTLLSASCALLLPALVPAGDLGAAEVAVLVTSDDYDLDWFGSPHLLPSGSARFSTRDFAGDDLYVQADPGGTIVLAADGDGAGIAGATMLLGNVVFADDATFVHRATLQGGKVEPSESQASLTSAGQVIQQSGHTAAPGIPDATLDFAAVLRYQRGRLALVSFLGGTGANCPAGAESCATGVFSGSPGSLAKVVRLGEEVGGFEVGLIHTGPSATELLDDGTVAHIVGLRGAGVTAGEDDAVVLRNTAIVARRGDPAPGGGTYGYFSKVEGGPGGTFLFHSNQGLFDEGWFHHDGSDVRRVVYSGDAVSGGFVSSVGAAVVAGNTAIVAAELGSIDVLLLWQSGSLGELARRGDPAPGTGETFESFVPGIASSGRIVFAATLSDGGAGVWAAGCGGGAASAALLLRTGNAVEVGPGDSRVVSSVDFFPSNGGSGFGRTLGVDGTSLFRVDFSDGSRGVVRLTPPSSCLLLFDGFESGDLSAWSG